MPRSHRNNATGEYFRVQRRWEYLLGAVKQYSAFKRQSLQRNRAWWYMPAISALGRQEDQELNPQLCAKFKASLEYLPEDAALKK